MFPHIFPFATKPNIANKLLSKQGDQPGCSTDTCAHNRVIPLYAESITSTRFVARRCSGWAQINSRNCPVGQGTAVMGGDSSKALTGVFFLTTNSNSPFAQGWNYLLMNKNENWITSSWCVLIAVHKSLLSLKIISDETSIKCRVDVKSSTLRRLLIASCKLLAFQFLITFDVVFSMSKAVKASGKALMWIFSSSIKILQLFECNLW